jgi:hypothetical protein
MPRRAQAGARLPRYTTPHARVCSGIPQNTGVPPELRGMFSESPGMLNHAQEYRATLGTTGGVQMACLWRADAGYTSLYQPAGRLDLNRIGHARPHHSIHE